MSFDLRVLNQLVSEVTRFGRLYRVPRRDTFPGSSPKPVVAPRPPRRSSSVVTYSPPREEPSLSKLAHLATRADFEIYSELRLPASSFGPRQSTEFFVRRNVQTPSSTIEPDHLAELNRLARLVELTSASCKMVPIYGQPPRLSENLTHVKTHQMVIAELLGFTRFGILQPFSKVFPKTDRPQIEFVSGLPQISKDKFNKLLVSKMSELRSRLGINTSPNGSLKLIASWINCLLAALKPKAKPHPSQKGKKKTSSAEKTEKKTKVDFIPAALSSSDPEIPASSHEVKVETSDHPTLQRLSVLPPNDSTVTKEFDALRSLSTADQVAHARLLLTDHAHLSNKVRLLKECLVPMSTELECDFTNLVLSLAACTGISKLQLWPYNSRPDRIQFEYSEWSYVLPHPDAVHRHVCLLTAYDLLAPFFRQF